jgi:CBS domain-containing protein
MDMLKLRAKDLMKSDPKTVGKSTSLSVAAKMMQELCVSSLIVEPDDEGDAFGIITRKDIIEAFVSNGIDATPHLVEDAMSKPAITVNSGLSIRNCQQMMRMLGVRRMPVVDGSKLVGVLSNSDIFAKLIEQIA